MQPLGCHVHARVNMLVLILGDKSSVLSHSMPTASVGRGTLIGEESTLLGKKQPDR